MNRQAQQGETPYEVIKRWLDNDKMRNILQRTLPMNVPVEPWIHIALATIKRDKKLAQCTTMSLMGSLMTAAGMGFRLEGVLGQAYLEAYAVREKDDRGNWVVVAMEAQLQVGYKGFVDLAYRIPGVVDIDVSTVRRNDFFEFQRGSNAYARHGWDHRMTKEERGPIALMYSALRYKDGYYAFGEPHMFEDVEAHRRTVLKDKYIRVEENEDGSYTYIKSRRDGTDYIMSDYEQGNNAWISWPMAMYKKTVIRWDAKLWNLSPDFQRAAQLVAMDDAGVSQNMSRVAAESIPSSVMRELDGGQKRVLAPAQPLSLATSRSLGQQMARESGALKGGAPSSSPDKPGQPSAPEGASGQAKPRTAPKGAPKPVQGSRKGRSGKGDMTDEEKQAALELEMQEAAEHDRNNT